MSYSWWCQSSRTRLHSCFKEDGYSFEWVSGQNSRVTPSDKRIQCNTETNVPIVVSGLSIGSFISSARMSPKELLQDTSDDSSSIPAIPSDSTSIPASGNQSRDSTETKNTRKRHRSGIGTRPSQSMDTFLSANRRVNESFSIRRASRKSATQTILWNLTNSVKNYHGIIELSWNNCTSTLHLSQRNDISERTVRRIHEGTSALLVQSGLDDKWWVHSAKCPRAPDRLENLMNCVLGNRS